MGTNYYLYKNVCEHCGRGDGPIHIGKSSAGWCFGLHVDSEIGVNSLDDWKCVWSQPGSVIKDEYGEVISPSRMLQVITERSWPKRNFTSGGFYRDEQHFMESNHAVRGPKNLVRHAIDGWSCIGHGEGTWDLCKGEFS